MSVNPPAKKSCPSTNDLDSHITCSTCAALFGILHSVKTIACVLLLGFALPGLAGPAPGEIELEAETKIYGQYPKNYKEIILHWLEKKLADPQSAQIEWTSEPKPAELPGPDGKRLFGYLVEFKVAARNQFGFYTGKQKHGALIKDGQVIKGTGFGF